MSCHYSMGALVALSFLTQQKDLWKYKHIQPSPPLFLCPVLCVVAKDPSPHVLKTTFVATPVILGDGLQAEIDQGG